MEITYNLGHVFRPGSSATEDAEVLRALLDCLIRIDIAFLRSHPNTLPLYQAGVRYGRTEIWEPIPALYARRYGDCKSLSAARIAELAVKRVEARPVFRWVQRPNGAKDFHILVQTLGGWEDPSKRLGMTGADTRYLTKGL